MFEGIVDSLLKLSPIFGLLVIAIWYLYKEKNYIKREFEDERKQSLSEISNLNKEMRESERENLIIISKLSEVVDKLYDDNKDQHEVIKQALKDEIKDIKELIKDKFNDLKK
jgi:gas vesicle protein